jgi:HEPN domain-containing protein
VTNNNYNEGLRWLDQAVADAKTASDCRTAKNFYACAFFSQQAAEKALKGYLYSQGYRALITHAVTDLVDEASKSQKQFKRYSDYAKELDRHYIGSRYPNFYPSGAPHKYYTNKMAEKCLNYAESILAEVKNYLKP